MIAGKEWISSQLRRWNLGILKYSTLQRLLQDKGAHDDLRLLLALPNEFASQYLKYYSSSKSQLRQDLFVLSELQFKRDGYFVEFGATDGIHLSNSFLLEKEFNWKGILAEPAKCWHNGLKANRTAHIETRCVWKDSHSSLTFNEVNDAEFSTIQEFREGDSNKVSRRQTITYQVQTISLNDLLAKYQAPESIDYLSIDTEGSEYDILSQLDFGKYSFKVITCEHNFTPNRDKLFNLLTKHGYRRKFEDHSQFDDWYVKL